MSTDRQEPAVLLERQGAVAWVSFNRPEEMNALSLDVVRALADALTRAQHDSEVRCVVLRGNGGMFCAGGHLRHLRDDIQKDDLTRRAGSKERLNYIHQAILAMRHMPKPVIASIAGAAAGGGLGVALAADWSIAASSAKLGYAYDRIGLSPDAGTSYWLPRLLGQRKAMELALFGGTFDAPRALAMGLLNEVVDEHDLDTRTRAVAEQLAAGPTYGYGRTKALLHRSLQASFEDQIEAERESVNDCLVSDDFKSAVQAFLNKTSPTFAGR